MATENKTKHPIKYDNLGTDVKSIKHALANALEYVAGKDWHTATQRDWLNVSSHVVRELLIEHWMETMRTYYREDTKRVYYLSMEFLMGRTLMNSLLNLGITTEFAQALDESGINLEEICEIEADAALGNGGLGRLAACFLDSMATLNIPGYGYGIRYEYGMFHQQISNGYQVEHPDSWLRYGNTWEFPRAEVLYPVSFYGNVVEYKDESGETRHHWCDTEEVMAMAYDTPIPGYGTDNTNNMRLWAAKSSRDFDLKYFNEGNYIKAVESKNESENISCILYPDDTTSMGKELRLKQQYFFVCASIQDMLLRYNKYHDNLDNLPDKVAVQLNDTHPAIAIAELMRIMLDQYKLPWKKAWDISTRVFSYTNHTLMPEALEKWPVSLFGKLFPRHLQIIYEINHHFLKGVMHKNPGDNDLLRRVSIIEEHEEKYIRMAHLAIVGSHKVNGVAKLHTQLMKSTIFADFDRYYPGKFINKTNGITPRRWLHHCNKPLSDLITGHIGKEWVTDLNHIHGIESLANDTAFKEEFAAVKMANKRHLASLIKHHLDIDVNLNSLFDVQIKRLHEYKRQYLNVLHVITLYNRIRDNNLDNIVPRTCIFSGKAAPGYYKAKLIIKLINDIADIVNNDPAVGDKLKVVFIPNYDVTTAGDIIPAADLSEQISTAGTEASGTGNMKLSLNGALTIGTMDGANIEIHDAVGEDNIFIFGNTVDQVQALQHNGYNPGTYYDNNDELKRALDMVRDGFFSPDEPDLFKPLVSSLLEEGDQYMVLADYADYIACQDRVSALYKTPDEWVKKTIINVANMGGFSSDRTIKEYAEEIWDIKPVKITMPKK